MSAAKTRSTRRRYDDPDRTKGGSLGQVAVWIDKAIVDALDRAARAERVAKKDIVERALRKAVAV